MAFTATVPIQREAAEQAAAEQRPDPG